MEKRESNYIFLIARVFSFRLASIPEAVDFVRLTCTAANRWALLQDSGPVATPLQDCRAPATAVSPPTFILRDTAVHCPRSHRPDWRWSAVHRVDTRGERPRRPSTLGEFRSPLPPRDPPGLLCPLLLPTCTRPLRPRKLLRAFLRELDRRSPFKVRSSLRDGEEFFLPERKICLDLDNLIRFQNLSWLRTEKGYGKE